jgi:hypothetical protein
LAFEVPIFWEKKKLSIGVYPDISLADARLKREEARLLLWVVTREKKKAEKLAKKASVENTFKAIALEWHEYKRPNWSKGYAEDLMEAFENDIFPDIGKRPIAEITPLEVLNSLRKLEKLLRVRPAIRFFAMPLSLAGLKQTQPLN